MVIAATSEPASGSDSANAAIFSPAATAGRYSALQLVVAEQRDRAAAEALHREREVGQRVVVGERLAREAQRAHVERLGHGVVEPPVSERS